MVMADTGAGSAKRKRKELTEEQKKAKRDSDRARAKTSVNLVRSFNRWRELQDLKGFKFFLSLASKTNADDRQIKILTTGAGGEMLPLLSTGAAKIKDPCSCFNKRDFHS